MKSFYEMAQDALPVLTHIPPLRELDKALIESCKDYSDAVCLCLESRIRKLQEGEIAAYLGFKRPQLAKVKMGIGRLDRDQETLLQRLCSNKAIQQYSEMRERQLDEMLEKPDLPAGMEALVARLVEEQLSRERGARAA
jgi:hypothetical protein